MPPFQGLSTALFCPTAERSRLIGAAVAELCQHFRFELQLLNQSPRSVDTNRQQLNRFVNWCAERGVTHVSELSVDVIQAYRHYLFHYRIPGSDRPLAASTQGYFLMKIRSLCRWMFYQKISGDDFAKDLQIPYSEKKLISNFLTVSEMGIVLTQPDLSTRNGVRDRAILETFFSTAIRTSELSNLMVSDIDVDRRVVLVRQGKGRKDRVVPIGKQALDWIDKYRREVRWIYATNSPTNILFLSSLGRPMVRSVLSALVHGYIRSAKIGKSGSCHMLRHTAATLMLENGADLRSLQTYLGHAGLETTQRYTHLTIDRLRAVHAKTHPTGDDRTQTE